MTAPFILHAGRRVPVDLPPAFRLGTLARAPAAGSPPGRSGEGVGGQSPPQKPKNRTGIELELPGMGVPAPVDGHSIQVERRQ